MTVRGGHLGERIAENSLNRLSAFHTSRGPLQKNDVGAGPCEQLSSAFAQARRAASSEASSLFAFSVACDTSFPLFHYRSSTAPENYRTLRKLGFAPARALLRFFDSDHSLVLALSTSPFKGMAAVLAQQSRELPKAPQEPLKAASKALP